MASAEALARREIRLLGCLVAGGLIWAAGQVSRARASDIRDGYIHQVWKTEQGLPDNKVQDILQTRDGYVWVATRRGLARFDGVRFTVFNRANTSAMTRDHCVALTEDTEGFLWVATEDRLLRGIHGRFTVMKPPYKQELGATRPLSSRHGGIWLASSLGIARWQNGRWRTYGKEEGLFSGLISALYEEADGTLRAGISRDLHWIDPRTDKVGRDLQFALNIDQGCFGIQRDLEGRLCILVNDGTPFGAWLYMTEDGHWQRVPERLPVQFISDPVNGFLKLDRQGNLWFPGLTDHLNRFRGNTPQAARNRQERPTRPASSSRLSTACPANASMNSSRTISAGFGSVRTRGSTGFPGQP